MAELLRQFFLNPAMLAGTALVSVPIIIYLINRQRYQRRRWAAMEFLLRAAKRNRRRIQLQNLLLLLVRCAVIVLIALALARPIQRHGAISLSPDANQNWVLALDDSYSMGFREGGASLFEEARETIGRMFDGIIKPGDQVAVMTFGKAPRVVVPPARVNDETRGRVLREVDEIRLATGAVNLGASFAALDDLSSRLASPSGEPQPKKIVLFSDFQRRDWLAAGEERSPGAAAPPAAGAPGGDSPAPSGERASAPAGDGPRDPTVLAIAEKIQKEGGRFLFARLGDSENRPNLAITALSAKPALIAEDVWVEIRATVRNFSAEEIGNVDLTIQVDPDPKDAALEPQLGDVVRVPPRGSVTRVLHYRFTESGHHTVAAELRSDGLAIDNRRYLVLPVEPSIRVLLVDGDPAADPLERETSLLAWALEPEDDAFGVAGRYTPFATHTVTAEELGGVEWKDHAVVVLANVAEMPAEKAEELKRYVKAGGALLVFLGANVRPDFYHQAFREEGESLLPGTIGEVKGDRNARNPVHLEIGDERHPLAVYFEERKELTHLLRPVVSFFKYYEVNGLDAKAARVAFRFTDAGRSPAVFDNGYGAGRVLWVPTTADQDWNELSKWPDFVVFLYEAISYLVQFGMESSNLMAGEPFRRTYPASQYASEVMLLVPESDAGDLDRVRNLRKAMRSLEGGTEFELVHDATEAPGLYRLDLLRPATPGADTVEHFAVNIDVAESDLRAMSSDDFAAFFGGLGYTVFDATERLRVAKGEESLVTGREFWRTFLACVLGLLAVETVLAFLFGRRSAA